MKMISYSPRTPVMLLMAIFLGFYSEHLLANDSIFIGKYASETRENFGRDKYGEFEINVDRNGEKYILSISQDGVFMFDVEAMPCDPKSAGHLNERKGYLNDHPPGEVYVLCDVSYKTPVLVYSQNGIKDPMADIYKEKGIKNPRTDLYYRTQYYAQIKWGFYGFRKIK